METSAEVGAQAADAGRVWLVLHVRPRAEKKAMDRLSRLGGFRYLPTYVKVTRVQRRKVRRELPLFPGYVFAHLSADERAAMLRTNLVVNMIRDPFPRQTVRQLRQISRAARLSPVVPSPRAFREGEPVRVKYGPLRGMSGYVQRAGAQAALCINVDILGSSVLVSVSPADLEPA